MRCPLGRMRRWRWVAASDPSTAATSEVEQIREEATLRTVRQRILAFDQVGEGEVSLEQENQ